ncbi:TIGR03088 family PEP-CTERM/XrtA system glycosyltransferase [Pelomonas sp. KK5]|uniref:TIGR03088 family PEP-CTERM/XrtA system glycosyltransferase n=1 Tax=Pelomonas sp. KK5 TaxID=1855730 RepID=UPI0009F97061|nr:TIGR03088 family PEP-CTERM/XrtA system glycosyltransferase [Pelomonas sp. KK5]
MSRTKPLLIVHVIHHLVIGGMENGVVNLINRMPKDRFRHAVVCIEDYSDFRDRIEDTSVEVHAMHRSKIGAWRLRWRLWRIFRQLRPDIVHTRGLSGLDALLAARLAGAKTVHSEHGYDVDNLSGQASKPALLRRLHAPLVQRFVSVSRDLERTMSERWGAPRRLIRQIYNGVDVGRFRPAEAGAHRLLPAELQAADPFVIGTVGRLQQVKDQATLLRAFASVLERWPEWRGRLRLALVGDGPMRESLHRLADELGIEGQTWFAGARNDIADLLRGFDVFVLPSLNEGISNTLLEAMASGVPVLASAVGGNVELLDPGVVGEGFAAGDDRALAAMIENYVSDANRCLQHGAAARRRAVEHFSLQAMVAGYADVYQGL